MDIEGRRRSEQFEDRGRGAGGSAAGLPIHALLAVVRLLGFKGTLILAAVLGIGYCALPASLRQQLFGTLAGPGSTQGGPGSGSVCQASPENGKACDFSRAVLASTEDVWTAQFQKGAVPSYGTPATQYQLPTLVVFAGGVSTAGCGNASSASGPFYCPADRKLYIDPGFYDVMEKRLKAPGDFAQAYVIAHEVGHHLQNLIGATSLQVPHETKNQVSVRVELQADCFAGVWGHTARADLKITDEDLREAVNAAHAIGDDALGNSSTTDHTHGSSAQRMRWFRKGFDSGDPRSCDTFAIPDHSRL
jgi:predicted metalloprotease